MHALQFCVDTLHYYQSEGKSLKVIKVRRMRGGPPSSQALRPESPSTYAQQKSHSNLSVRLNRCFSLEVCAKEVDAFCRTIVIDLFTVPLNSPLPAIFAGLPSILLP